MPLTPLPGDNAPPIYYEKQDVHYQATKKFTRCGLNIATLQRGEYVKDIGRVTCIECIDLLSKSLRAGDIIKTNKKGE